MAMSNQSLNTIHNGFSVPQSHDHHCTELKRESEITAAKTYVWEPAWSKCVHSMQYCCLFCMQLSNDYYKKVQGIAHVEPNCQLCYVGELTFPSRYSIHVIMITNHLIAVDFAYLRLCAILTRTLA